jgi:hypothetical protein
LRQKQLVCFRYNVPAHSIRIVKLFLMKRGVPDINNPPFSLDVTLVNPFPKVKTFIKRIRLQYFEDIKSEVAVELNVVNLDAFRNCKF